MSREAHVRFCESIAVEPRCATRPVAESFFGSLKTERVFFTNYKNRDEAGHVVLGIMGGLSGLAKIFSIQGGIPRSKGSARRVYVARNVLAKAAKKSKQLASMTCGPFSPPLPVKKAMEFFDQFVGKREMTVPSAVVCLDKTIASCSGFFDLPEEEWIALRTTNIIECIQRWMYGSGSLRAGMVE